MKYNEITFGKNGQTFRIKRWENNEVIKKELETYVGNGQWLPVENTNFIKELFLGNKEDVRCELPQLDR